MRRNTSTFDKKKFFFGCNKRDRQQKTIRDGEPRTATSTFTQLLSSADVEETTMVIKIPSSVDVEKTTMIIKTPSCGRRRDNHDYKKNQAYCGPTCPEAEWPLE